MPQPGDFSGASDRGTLPVTTIKGGRVPTVTPPIQSEDPAQNSQKMTLVLNEYKTSAKYGEKKIELNPTVRKVLRKWFRHNGSGHLLTDKHGRALGSNGITKTWTRIGQKHLGKSLGSSLLRHSYLSDKYAETNEEKQKDADLMMHSVAMQDGYIKT